MAFDHIIMTRAAHHFYGKFPDHPITTGVDIYPVISKSNSERISDLEYVDNYTHQTFRYSEDVWVRTQQKTDKWNFMSEQGLNVGDCEDFAITKIQLLLERGWSISSLKLEIGFRDNPPEEGGGITGHAWLVAAWGSNEFVLDKGFGRLESREEIKQEWGKYGWKQIIGRRWGLVLQTGEVSEDPFYQFEITPVPYLRINQSVLTMTGNVSRKQ